MFHIELHVKWKTRQIANFLRVTNPRDLITVTCNLNLTLNFRDEFFFYALLQLICGIRGTVDESKVSEGIIIPCSEIIPPSPSIILPK